MNGCILIRGVEVGIKSKLVFVSPRAPDPDARSVFQSLRPSNVVASLRRILIPRRVYRGVAATNYLDGIAVFASRLDS